jgi:GNAT superfamily N-acetyltransferase
VTGLTYRLSDERAELDMDRIFHWLNVESFWAKGRPRDVIERAFAGSYPVGAYTEDQQVAVARIISDGATFGWLADVFVDVPHRGRGLGIRLAQWAVDWMQQRGVQRMVLATADAHGVYATVGFQPLQHPQRLMEIDRRPQRDEVLRVERESIHRAPR